MTSSDFYPVQKKKNNTFNHSNNLNDSCLEDNVAEVSINSNVELTSNLKNRLTNEI